MKKIRLTEKDLQRISKKVLNEITSDDITKGVNRQMYRGRITNMDSPEDFLGHDFETIGQAKDKEWDKEEERKQDIHDEIYEIIAPILDNIHDKYDLNGFDYDVIGDIVDNWYYTNTDEEY